MSSVKNMKRKSIKFDHTKLFRMLFFMGISSSLLLMLIIAGVFWLFSKDLPKIITVADYRPLTVTRVFGLNHQEVVEIGEFFKERRYVIPYEKIPQSVIQAFISAEDDQFFDHPGINITSMVRAGIANFRAGHVVQGGSTITQQVAKSLLLTPERSFDRKIKEIILASRIERNLTKQQILYLYLNQIYLGHGAYGVQAASRMFFRKDVSDLTLAEAAILAGMPQAPGKFSPHLNPKKAKERQIYVLRRMLENKFISQNEFKSASNEALRIYHDEDFNGKYAPYYVEHIRRHLVERFGEKTVYEEGLSVYTPIQISVATAAKRSIEEGLRSVDKRMGFRGPVKRLQSESEIEKFIHDQRAFLIDQKLHFKVLDRDGQLDALESIPLSQLTSERDLLDPGVLYQAVVTGIDSTKKSLQVMIGHIRAEIPADQMKWARYLQGFKRGDVIFVSLVSLRPDVIVALDQKPQLQGALFSMNVQTGEVLSMVGGYDFEQSEFNRATQALRQPGSAFKPVIYAAALEKGFTPASIIVDAPMVFKDSDGMSSWKPNNFESKFYGDTTFRQALIKSRNIPTIKLVQSIQVPQLIQFARRIGMASQFTPDLSIALGSSTISLMDLTRVYALFPRHGRKILPSFIKLIQDRDGKTLEEFIPKPIPSSIVIPKEELAVVPSPSGSPSASEFESSRGVHFPIYPLSQDQDQVLDPRVAFVMTHLMKEVVHFGTGHEAKNLGRPAAGKTGTTNEYMDGWFIGFTPYIVTGVWVGFDAQKTIGQGETGAKVALPIWLSFMKEAVKESLDSDFTMPPGVVFSTIDANTGKLTSPNSSSAIKEAFIAGTEPSEFNSSSSSSSEVQGDFFTEDRE